MAYFPTIRTEVVKTVWWRCGAKDCKAGHVDQKRAENCPKRKRAMREWFKP